MEILQNFYIGSKNSSIYFCLYEKKRNKKQRYKTDIKNRFEIRLKSGKAEQTIEQLVFSRNPEQTIASLILTQIDFPVYILWDIFLDNVTTSLPFIMTPVAVNMDKTKRWLERQVMPSLLMIKEIEKQTGANYLEEIDRHTRLTEKQELKIKQMTTDIADMIEKDTAVPQGNDGIFNFFKKSATKRLLAYRYGARKGNLTFSKLLIKSRFPFPIWSERRKYFHSQLNLWQLPFPIWSKENLSFHSWQ